MIRMASLIHMHMENYGHRNAGDEAFSSEILLPPCLPHVDVSFRDVKAGTLILSCGAASAAVGASLGINVHAPASHSFVVSRETVHSYVISEMDTLLTLIPSKLTDVGADTTWITALLEECGAKRVIVVDNAPWPTNLRAKPAELVFQLTVNVEDGPAAIPILPTPLLLDGIAAQVLTICAERAIPAIGCRVFGGSHDIFTVGTGRHVHWALESCLSTFRLPALAIDASSEFSALFTGHAKKLMLSTDTLTAKTMFS